MSPCGKENNFIKPADTPIVFDGIQTEAGGSSESSGTGQVLVYGDSLTAALHPLGLYMSPHGGRMYLHAQGLRLAGVALARSQLALQVAGGISLFDSTAEAREALRCHGERWQALLQVPPADSPTPAPPSIRRRRSRAPASPSFPHRVDAALQSAQAVGGGGVELGCPLLGLRVGGPEGQVLLSQAELDAAAPEEHLWPVWDVRVHPGHTVAREFWPEAASSEAEQR